ncbi:MAG: response regulator [Lentisphaerae bacterium]|nr:MAG: response regulator [Lentisphaerota bacterium]
MRLTRDLTDLEGTVLRRQGAVLDAEAIHQFQGSRHVDPIATRFYISTYTLIPDREHANKPIKTPSVPNSPGSNSPLPDAVTTTPSPQSIRERSWRPVVFAVDDELYILHSLKRELRRAKIDVETFNTPQALLEAIQTPPRELIAVITDFKMPGIKGDMLINRIKRSYPSLPCIVLTGETTRENIQKLIQSGTVHAILRKPWDRERLLQLLNELADIRENASP